MTCRSCGKPLPRDADARRVYCTGTCRQRAFRARDTAVRQAAHDLVTRQTRAILDGDFAALADIQREAARIFGPA